MNTTTITAALSLPKEGWMFDLDALKVLHSQLTSDDIEKFLTEARNIAHLVHPHIVRVLEFGVEGKTPFLVMDYASNGTLRQRHPKGTRLTLATIVSYVRQVASALQYAYDQRLIHRDIKPENMLVGRHNDILLSDFGIALVAQSSRYQSTQEVAGTAAYMSPEQIQGKPRPASDQYSLGIVVYEWLSGDRPFHGSFNELCAQHMFASPPPLRDKAPTILPNVEQVVMIALAKDPCQRFASMQAFATALEQASLSATVQPQSLTAPPSSERNSLRETSPVPKLPTASIPTIEPAQPSLSLSSYPASPLLPTASSREKPAIYTQQPTLQAGQTIEVAPAPSVRQAPNFGLILGIVFLLLMLIGSSIFFFTRSLGTGKNVGNPGSNSSGSTGAIVNGIGCKKIGVLLPETATSARWDNKDKPLLEQLIPQNLPGAPVDYANAGGDADLQQTQAQEALTKGDCILVIAPSDSIKSAAIVAAAKAKSVPVIAYDRLIYSNDLNYYQALAVSVHRFVVIVSL